MGKFLAMLGSMIAATSCVSCAMFWVIDEPKMPKSLIEK